MYRSLCKRLCAVVLCLFILMLASATAIADESIQVSIPVIAWGHDCSVALFDEHGNRIQLLNLTAGVQNSLTVQVNGLKRFVYQAYINDKNTEDVTFDHTNYTIFIDVLYASDGQILPIVTIENYLPVGGKLWRVEFFNEVTAPTPTPTPIPTPTPTPVPTVTPEPYDDPFIFHKVWSGGIEESIDWTLYTANGSPYHKLFNKYEITETEWRYEAYFQGDVSDFYVIERPIEGYQTIYKNVGEYSAVTDRCHFGGTIINYKLPETGDDTPLATYTAMVAVALLGAWLLVVSYRKQTSGKKS